MIEIFLSDKTYENDVYPLVKAFYPEEDIKVYESESEFKDKAFCAPAHVDENADSRVSMTPDSMADILSDGRKSMTPDRIDIAFRSDHIGIHISGAGITASSPADTSLTANSSADTGTAADYGDWLILPHLLGKSQYKNAMKRFLYRLLSDASGRTLPWGILTGIRPTKLVYELLGKGEPEAAIYHHMESEYLCSEDKISMSIEIARREVELLRELDYRNGYSLYIGIPFCPSTCLYCSFPSYSITKFSGYVEQYLDALEKEIRYAATCFPKKKLTSVYLGGGTPTTLSAGQLDRLLGLIREQFDFTRVREFCVEAGRPDSITAEKLEVLCKRGVDRISINPQSMQQKTLDLIGRRHSVEQVKEAFHLARETGFGNINMDIILGLPGEGREDVADTLRQIGKLNPESLTVHTLAIKRAARLNLERENYAGRKASHAAEMMEAAQDFAKANDYLPYYLYRQKNMADNLENIGYAKYGREGIYNILIMEEKQTILALGAGGTSKFVFHQEDRIERVDNVKNVTDYISRIDEMIERKRRFLQENPI